MFFGGAAKGAQQITYIKLTHTHTHTHTSTTTNHQHQANSLEQKKAELRPGTYVRVYGSLKHYQGYRITAFAVRPIHDFNELTHHNLQAVFQHLHLLKGGGTGAGVR